MLRGREIWVAVVLATVRREREPTNLQGRAPCECAQCERVGNIVLNTQTGTRSREGSGLHLV